VVRASPTPTATPLCPTCGHEVVCITTSVTVRYQVAVQPGCQDLLVIDETLDEEGWDEQAPASCEACGWRGQAAALNGAARRRRA